MKTPAELIESIFGYQYPRQVQGELWIAEDNNNDERYIRVQIYGEHVTLHVYKYSESWHNDENT